MEYCWITRSEKPFVAANRIRDLQVGFPTSATNSRDGHLYSDELALNEMCGTPVLDALIKVGFPVPAAMQRDGIIPQELIDDGSSEESKRCSITVQMKLLYFRMMLNRESITNATDMIQPSLISYSFQSLPSPALLDVASISADRILLLNSYFIIVIFHGMTIGGYWVTRISQNIKPKHH
ncbi:hypothetical protein L1987_20049 [Smallanthus sonchifolius]|uniref:Uncharacterized protein n=1 Tax=Smallanthus sonchifolius TaxID=185202 RepID=A0ACB9IRI5_9ASTR|nr:hypothetical protein L1987_20049 [Smallanthus sonchifolius]